MANILKKLQEIAKRMRMEINYTLLFIYYLKSCYFFIRVVKVQNKYMLLRIYNIFHITIHLIIYFFVKSNVVNLY